MIINKFLNYDSPKSGNRNSLKCRQTIAYAPRLGPLKVSLSASVCWPNKLNGKEKWNLLHYSLFLQNQQLVMENKIQLSEV